MVVVCEYFIKPLSSLFLLPTRRVYFPFDYIKSSRFQQQIANSLDIERKCERAETPDCHWDSAKLVDYTPRLGQVLGCVLWLLMDCYCAMREAFNNFLFEQAGLIAVFSRMATLGEPHGCTTPVVRLFLPSFLFGFVSMLPSVDQHFSSLVH